jgi:hypothetical protein
MTRIILSRFIDLVGITDASIMLHRYLGCPPKVGPPEMEVPR